MARSTRHWAALAVILAWGGALLWLALRNSGQTDQARIAEQASLRLAPGDAWFRVMAGEVQIGYAGITVDTLSGGRYRIQEQIALDLPSDSALTRAIRSTDFGLGSSITVETLASRLSGLGREIGIEGTGNSSEWRLNVGSGGADGAAASGILDVVQPGRPQPLAPVPLRVVPLRLALVGALATGEGRTMPIAANWPPVAWTASIENDGIAPMSFADSSEILPGDSVWQVVRRDTVETHALLVDSPDGAIRLQVDDRGTLVGAEYAFGVRWVREDFDIARFNYRQALDSIGAEINSLLPRLVPQQGSAAAADTGDVGTTYQVTRRDGSPIRPSLLRLMAEGRQQVLQGNLVVRARASAGRRDRRASLADALVQTDDPAVMAFAEQFSPADDSDLPAMVTAIRNRISLDPSPAGAIDAAGAIRGGKARPEGLARVITAVLQRHRYQARMVVGVRPGAGDTLYSHAWVEYVRGRSGPWQALDPFSGEPLDTRWVRVSHGGSTAPHDLLPLVADVRFTPVRAPVTEGEGE